MLNQILATNIIRTNAVLILYYILTTRGKAVVDKLNCITFMLDFLPSKAPHLGRNEGRYVIGINTFSTTTIPLQSIMRAPTNNHYRSL